MNPGFLAHPYDMFQLMIFRKSQSYDNLVQFILRQHNRQVLRPAQHLHPTVFCPTGLVVCQNPSDNVPPLRIRPNPVYILLCRPAVAYQQDMLLIVAFLADVSKFLP